MESVEFKEVLTTNILPYWLRLQDKEHGGFYGQVLADETVVQNANRGAILYGRILWTFSAAYRELGNKEYLEAATNAKDYILEHFIDRQYGGVYWELDYLGNPVNDRKQFYALGFVIYGLTEYIRATGDITILPYAVDLYHCLEQHAWDPTYGGYIEATQRDWSKIEDYRLSEKDLNAPKSQNTHLHILEPYTNLYRVWPTEELKHSILRLIDVFKNHIVQPSGHLGLFFDNNWNIINSKLSNKTASLNSTLSTLNFSCGHDIEFSWLLDEACEVIGVNEDETVQRVAQAAKEGLQPNGLMEGTWWEQCETIIGYMNIFHRFGGEENLRIAERCWKATQQYFIDFGHGEWWEYPRLPYSSTPLPLYPQADKAGFWKCPYHNSRLCLQIINAL